MFLFRVLDSYLSILLVISLNGILVLAVEPELKLVNVVFRHGDRTPDNNGHELYPTDPYLNYSFYPTGLGQLTLAGKMREYTLGQVLRDRYNKFLGDVYVPNEALGHSSNYDRTKMSLQLVLAGLFPPVDKLQRWNPNLNWQPIPATYVPRVDDNFFLADECPQYLNEYNRVLNMPETKAVMNRYAEMKSNLTKLTGRNVETFLNMYYLYHTLMAEKSLGLKLPEWTRDYFPDGLLFNATVAAYNVASATPLLKRLYSGPIIRTFLDNMMATQNRLKPTKIYLYGGHETNVAALLHAFDVYKPHVPHYSSAVILELLQQDKQYYVKLLHYLGIPPVVEELKMPNCEILCPFNKFMDIIQVLLPSDEELACDKRQTPDYAGTKYPSALQTMIQNLLKQSASGNNRRR